MEITQNSKTGIRINYTGSTCLGCYPGSNCISHLEQCNANLVVSRTVWRSIKNDSKAIEKEVLQGILLDIYLAHSSIILFKLQNQRPFCYSATWPSPGGVCKFLHVSILTEWRGPVWDGGSTGLVMRGWCLRKKSGSKLLLFRCLNISAHRKV